MNDTVNRKYILTLAALAATILVAGAFLKPVKAIPDPPSPTEMASLQAAVRRKDLGDTASYFAQRAQSLSENVIYDRLHESSSVAWEKRGQVLATHTEGSESPTPPLFVTSGDAGNLPTRSREPEPGHWLLIVGRTDDNQVLWTPAIYGGVRQTRCSGETFRELVVNARVGKELSGAGAFDLDGVLVGFVANCDGAYHLVSISDISSLLQAFQKPARKIESVYGLVVEKMNAVSKPMFPNNSGLFVTEVKIGEPADRTGLKAGDLIMGNKTNTFESVQDLWGALSSSDAGTCTFNILRNGKGLLLTMPSPGEADGERAATKSMGIRIVPENAKAETLFISPGTSAYRAGLRTGDRLLQVGAKPGAMVLNLSRVISSMGNQPLFVVYERNRAQRVALVAK